MKLIIFKKLGAKSNNCKFIEYPKKSAGYYFYHPVELKVFVSKYASFLEKKICS